MFAQEAGTASEVRLACVTLALAGVEKTGTLEKGFGNLGDKRDISIIALRFIIHGDLRDGRVDQLDVVLQVGRNRVGESSDRLITSLLVLEGGELSVKKVVGLLHGDIKSKPVARCGQRGGGKAVLGEPCVDCGESVSRGCDEFVDLGEN